MTASALNSASIVPNAVAGLVGAAAPGAAAGAMAGFDALLAALFPQGAVPEAAAATAAATGAPQTASLLAATPEPEAEDASVEAAVDETTPEVAADADPDVAAVLAAALVAPQAPVAHPATTAAAATDAAAHTPHAWGRDKAKGVPAQPAILHANPKADLLAKAGLATEAAPEDALALADAPAPETPAVAPQAAANAPAAPRAPVQAAAATMPPTAATPADAVDVAPATPSPADPQGTETAPAAPPADVPGQAGTQAIVGSRAAARPEPTPTARAERSKPGSEQVATGDVTAPEAADAPVLAKAVDAVAKPAASTAEDGAPKAAEAEAEPAADAPDAAPPADAKAAAQSAAPAAHTTHTVRGSPETVANLAAQIVKKLEGQSTRFDLELNPQGLGRVDVRIEIGAQGQLSAAMLFDNAQAAHELKARAAELQRALEQAGFNLSGGLSFDVADHGRQGQAWQDQGDTGSAFRGQAFRAALETAGDAADAAAQGALRLRRGVNAGLDLRI